MGKTVNLAECYPVFEKHPHVRGEDCRHILGDDYDEETPPRAWGRLAGFRVWMGCVRNTPTCVGKTKQTAELKKISEKHPHVRGDDDMLANTKTL